MKDIAEVRPLGSQVLVRRDPEDTMHGSIHLPEARRHQGKKGKGTVIAVGPGARKKKRVDLGYYEPDGNRATRLVPTAEREPVDVAPGDRVLFSRLAGADLEGYEGGDYVVLQHDDVLGEIEDE